MADKHYNFASVVGYPKVVTFEEPKGKKPYLDVEVIVPILEGNFTVFGQMRGNIDDLLFFRDYVSKNRGLPAKLTGVLTQFESTEAAGRRFTNFIFFRGEPTVNKECKATFVLSGEIKNLQSQSADTIVTLFINQSFRSEITDNDGIVILYALNPNDFRSLKVGNKVEVFGRLRPKTPENEYGEATSAIRPYIEKVNIIEA